MHADRVLVTGAEAVIVDYRPQSLIAVTFSAAVGVPALTYLLEAQPAFDFADGVARLAFELAPRELRRTVLDRLALDLPHDL